jgi:hypothetical protein
VLTLAHALALVLVLVLVLILISKSCVGLSHSFNSGDGM